MTNLIETMAKAMARRIVRAETIKMNLALGESELAAIERSADRLAPQCYEDASAALAAIEASGYRVVPVEPTAEMHAAGVSATGNHCLTNEVRCAYAAMLAAAPKVTE